MNKASPVGMRKALDLARLMAQYGILFVPMPVANEEEFNKKANEAFDALDRMAAEAESNEAEQQGGAA